MEVLNGEQGNSALDGQTLIQTVVSLTELSEPLVQEEMQAIIQHSGYESESLTLEQLRSAMLAYLESLQEEMSEVLEENKDLADQSDISKTPVILE